MYEEIITSGQVTITKKGNTIFYENRKNNYIIFLDKATLTGYVQSNFRSEITPANYDVYYNQIRTQETLIKNEFTGFEELFGDLFSDPRLYTPTPLLTSKNENTLKDTEKEYTTFSGCLISLVVIFIMLAIFAGFGYLLWVGIGDVLAALWHAISSLFSNIVGMF